MEATYWVALFAFVAICIVLGNARLRERMNTCPFCSSAYMVIDEESVVQCHRCGRDRPSY